jgi:hypothetical protein
MLLAERNSFTNQNLHNACLGAYASVMQILVGK